MMTSSMMRLTIFSTGIVMWQWHINTEVLMIISEIVLEWARQMCHFHLNMNIEGRFIVML